MKKRQGSPIRLGEPTDSRECLRFLVAVSQIDIAALKARERVALEKDTKRFLHRQNPGHWRESDKPDVTKLVYLQETARVMLTDLANGRLSLMAGDLTLSLWAFREGSEVRVTMVGHDADLWKYQIVRVLEDVGTSRLAVCPATFKVRGKSDRPCGKLFVKVTSKEFCSSRCQTRVTTRRNRGE